MICALKLERLSYQAMLSELPTGGATTYFKFTFDRKCWLFPPVGYEF